jgi:hypothetical protein
MGKLMDLVYNSWTIAGLWSMVDSTMASEWLASVSSDDTP